MRAIGVAAIGFAVWAGSMTLAWPRDLDGHYAQTNPDLHAWFNKLSSGKGLCCDFAEGKRVDDVDWDTGGPNGNYRVRLDGEWIDVPADAVVTEPNKFGPSVVWPMFGNGGQTTVRCFLPGSGS